MKTYRAKNDKPALDQRKGSEKLDRISTYLGTVTKVIDPRATSHSLRMKSTNYLCVYH